MAAAAAAGWRLAWSWCRGEHAVADAADGFEPVAVGAEFLAESFHVSVEGAAVGGIAVAPDGAMKIMAVLGFAGTLAQI